LLTVLGVSLDCELVRKQGGANAILQTKEKESGTGIGGRLSLASSASATPAAEEPQWNTARGNKIILADEEISDVSLATFHVFDKETEYRLRQGIRVAAGVAPFGGGCRGGAVSALMRVVAVAALMRVVAAAALMRVVAAAALMRVAAAAALMPVAVAALMPVAVAVLMPVVAVVLPISAAAQVMVAAVTVAAVRVMVAAVRVIFAEAVLEAVVAAAYG
jgi:hypothetical protein